MFLCMCVRARFNFLIRKTIRHDMLAMCVCVCVYCVSTMRHIHNESYEKSIELIETNNSETKRKCNDRETDKGH